MNKKHSVYLSAIVGAGKSDTAVFTDIAKAGKISVKIIKNFVKISALTFSLVFSLNSFGEKDIIRCDHFNLKTYSEAKRYIQRHDSDDIHTMRIMALSAFCIGKEKEGLEELKRLFSKGDIHGAYWLGMYYASSGTFDSSKWLTLDLEEDPENFATMIYYFEKTADRIISAVNYPEEVNPDHPGLAEHYVISTEVFLNLPFSYYEIYIRQVKNTFADSKSGKQVPYTDTISALVKMQNWSEQCLKRSALDVWESYVLATYAMKESCQIMNIFAMQALPLEQQRIKIVEDQCKAVPLHECTEHQNIVNQIMEESYTMLKILDFIQTISLILDNEEI